MSRRSVSAIVYLTIGWGGLLLALAALILPLVPATPFLLIASFGFARSSKRFHQRIRAIPRIGKHIAAWEDHGVLDRPMKTVSTTLVVPPGITAIALCPSLAVDLLVVGAALACLTFVWTRPDTVPAGAATEDIEPRSR